LAWTGRMNRRRKETGAMNREATGAIVSRRAGIFDVCDCSHSIYTSSFGCLEKGRPSVIGATYRILLKIRGFLPGQTA